MKRVIGTGTLIQNETGFVSAARGYEIGVGL